MAGQAIQDQEAIRPHAVFRGEVNEDAPGDVKVLVFEKGAGSQGIEDDFNVLWGEKGGTAMRPYLAEICPEIEVEASAAP